MRPAHPDYCLPKVKVEIEERLLSAVGSQMIAAEQFGPIPRSFAFGDGID
jgi:hypothetical protein